MTEAEVQIDTPNEPHITNPKGSPLMRALSNLRTRSLIYKEINIVAPLSKARFPVYLAKGGSDKLFAMTIFPLENNEEQNSYFENEIRFASLDHENIIKTLHAEPRKTVDYEDETKRISFILTEYAAYGDFFNFVTKYRDYFNDKLARTYFRQLIDGLEYLHKKGMAHLDLKLENLLLGEDFTLKISDFDLSYFDNDTKILSTGTKYFRSPELMSSACKNYQAADIYSAGVLLFVLKTGGVIPHSEDVKCRGISLFDLLYEDNEEFWKSQCAFQDRPLSFFSFDFKTLFNGMIKLSPEKRFTLKQVKNSNWYNGPVYTKEELKEYVQSFLKKA